jgi:hypothetical protein
MSSKPKIFSISHDNYKSHYRLNYQKENWIQSKLSGDFAVINMGNYYLELRNELTQLLLNKKIIPALIPLEKLHEYIGEDLKTYGNDGLGNVGTLLYENNDSFIQLLRRFTHHILYKKIIQEPFLFQATPTFRVHCPNAKNSSFFPHYHTDLAVGHSPQEINLWIPLTSPFSGHGFYLASLEDSKVIADYIDYDLLSLMDDNVFRDQEYIKICAPKFLPVTVKAGEGLIFDGRCFHTAMPIQSHTRISVDFRIILEKDFANSEYIYQNCGRRKQLLMLPNDFYYSKNAAELL